MNQELIDKLVPGLLGIVRVLALSRETISSTLEELAKQVRSGKHIPDAALQRANEDQATLEGIFGR